MLDTGHLMCSCPELKTASEAWRYVERMVDKHAEMRSYIKGVHLHESVTGKFAQSALQQALRGEMPLEEEYYSRYSQVYKLLGRIDTHQPVTCPYAVGVLEKIAPDYLVHELQVSSRAEREKKLLRQKKALKEGLTKVRIADRL